jgi:hypothetical protein
MCIRDGKNLDSGFDQEWKKFGSGLNIPDPQHWRGGGGEEEGGGGKA